MPRVESAPNSPAEIGSGSGGFAPCARMSNVRTWKPAALRNWAIGRVLSRADSQPWTSRTAGPGAPSWAGIHHPGSVCPADSIAMSS